MAKSNWLDRQLDYARSVVRSWSEWKREMIRSQIADVIAPRNNGTHITVVEPDRQNHPCVSVFVVDKYADLIEFLDAPPEPSSALRHLLLGKAPWDV
jgi:hypothetical protein